MAQHDYVIANGTGAAVRSDLNNALAAIVSQNSGATEPATTYAFQFWADTTTGTLKLRNSANSAWIELLQLDGTLTMEDGTEALPGLSFRSDLDTGLWRPGTNQLAISTNAVERVEFGASEVVFNDGGANYDFRVEGDTNANLLFVDASADAVGIGVSSPGEVLDVAGQARVTNTAAGSGLVIKRSDSVNANGALNFTGSDNTVDASVRMATDAADALTFQTAGSERVRITSGGAVGIGTTSPGVLLHLYRSGSDAFEIIETASSGNNAGLLIKTGGNELGYLASDGAFSGGTTNLGISAPSGSMVFRNGASNTERARIDTSGRLLVGTSTTSANAAQFQIVSSGEGADILRYGNNAAGTNINLYKTRGTTNTHGVVAADDSLGQITFRGSDGANYIASSTIKAEVDGTPGTNDMPGRLVFSTTADGASSPTERARITSGGYLKVSDTGSYIAATGNGHEVVLNNNFGINVIEFRHAGATTGNQLGIKITLAGDPNGTGNEFLDCVGNATRRAAIRSNGGLANFQANNVNLCDEREKKNIENLDSTWDCLKHWELKKFHYNEDADTEAKKYGVIAQQVEEHCPEVISEWVKQKAEPAKLDDEGNELEPAKEEIVRMGIKEQQMYWMAIKALQEAQVRIEQLEAKVAALESA